MRVEVDSNRGLDDFRNHFPKYNGHTELQARTPIRRPFNSTMRVALLLVVAMLLLAVVEPKVAKKTKKTPVKKKKVPVKKAGAKKVTPSAVHTKSKSATKDAHKVPTKNACGSTCKLRA